MKIDTMREFGYLGSEHLHVIREFCQIWWVVSDGAGHYCHVAFTDKALEEIRVPAGLPTHSFLPIMARVLDLAARRWDEWHGSRRYAYFWVNVGGVEEFWR